MKEPSGRRPGYAPKLEDRGGDRMLEFVKRDFVRRGEVVKVAGGSRPSSDTVVQ